MLNILYGILPRLHDDVYLHLHLAGLHFIFGSVCLSSLCNVNGSSMAALPVCLQQCVQRLHPLAGDETHAYATKRHAREPSATASSMVVVGLCFIHSIRYPYVQTSECYGSAGTNIYLHIARNVFREFALSELICRASLSSKASQSFLNPLLTSPVPGPDLAVRILSDVTERNDLETIHLVDEFLSKKKTVGLQGDQRTHSHAVALRAITSEDGMTADW
eukprot:Gb_06278 [translate_table: standard]